MPACVTGCHLGPPQIFQKLIFCAQSLSCLCQCTQAMGQRMGPEFLYQRKYLHLPKQCAEKCSADSKQLLLQDGILKDLIKMFMRAGKLCSFLQKCLGSWSLCQTCGTWPRPQDGEPNNGMEDIFSALNWSFIVWV